MLADRTRAGLCPCGEVQMARGSPLVTRAIVLPIMRLSGGSCVQRKVSQKWRHGNIGRLLNNAIRRFEGRVLDLMSEAGYAETRIAHINLTRNLDLEGTRLTDLAKRASMSKQAMGELAGQCEELGLISRATDPSDRRARIITFTVFGLEWLEAFHAAVDVAEKEMRREIGGAALDTMVQALAAYSAGFGTLDFDEK
jgi:DNA-binding MarR family transcriptional regulator